ncbi:MAG: hypothetical protein HRT64_11060 [Erythrobacter sp.]|nr:hypothetical protein [Erythrobacter sp.]
MIEELTEEQVWNLANSELSGDEDWPVVTKSEWEETESAVCLKRTKGGYVLGVSCDRDDAIRFFFAEDRDAMSDLAKRFEIEMKASGNPLSGNVEIARDF